jgi:hypothetical protein
VALFSNDLEKAEIYFGEALQILEDPNIKPTESFLGGKIVFNYMPLKPGDTDTTKYSIDFVTVESKKSMLYYDLSFVYALKGNYKRANQMFASARKFDAFETYDSYFAHKLVSVEGFIAPDPEVVSWIDDHIEALNQDE